MCGEYAVDVSETRLELVDDDIVYFAGEKELWRVAISELVIIGEYTKSSGPWFDDWFLIFGYREDGRVLFQDVPIPPDVEDVLAALGGRLGGQAIRLRLVNSTEWNSRVLWPETLVGKPFFNGCRKSLEVNPKICG